jgi:two-component system KDP operon response regulator KdpE
VILTVEDDGQMRRFFRVTLGARGFQLAEANTGQEGLAKTVAARPDVILLDLGLPDMDGLDLLERIREFSSVPVIVVSGRTGEDELVSALEMGADDYIAKPFHERELVARIQVALRHAAARAPGEPAVYTSGELRVDLAKRVVTLSDREVHLTPTEYALLAMLVKNAGKVLTHRMLLAGVWGPDAVEQTQYLRVYFGQLRHKLERDPARPVLLLNEPGVGYRLKEPR